MNSIISSASHPARIHLGCGHEILPGFVNLDGAALPGVDVVHDLRQMPWPFRDGAASEILIKHVLEHLPNTIEVMEEIWRISAPQAIVTIRVPYWNSRDFITDPTHVKAFNEHTLDFFDPRTKACRERAYYSKARFQVEGKKYWIRFLGKYLPVSIQPLKFILEFLSAYFSNVIQVIEFRLSAVK